MKRYPTKRTLNRIEDTARRLAELRAKADRLATVGSGEDDFEEWCRLVALIRAIEGRKVETGR